MAEVEGVDTLAALILAAGDDLKESKKAIRAGGNIVNREAKTLVSKRSGVLKKTGRVSVTKTAGKVRFGGKKAPHGPPHHFGHKNRPQGGFMLPNPFLYKAGDRRAEEVRQSFEDQVPSVLKSKQLK